ncbi:MAG: hypothetical protein C0617_03440 [Desulfuromonas sp.]|uniref:tetratricopeptide repeat protein n=1 Tax=Desulfuromonas sp. TaxID=892 RepID=UPI000CB0EF95|nr:tetratricopeptide repeat protein [Desulfuromonas sp.]PLX85744.1 MAG: hypothetical protein C0617_03440 [Desulfuromonas sp.]
MTEKQSPASLLGKIAEYTEILDRNPRSKVFVPLCEAYRQMGMLDDALEIAIRGVQNLSDYPDGYIALGRVQTQLGARSEALQAFEKALELDEGNLTALKDLARLLLQGDDKGRARELLQRAALLRPDDRGIARMLGSFSSEQPSASAPEASESNLPQSPEMAAAGRRDEPIATATLAEIYVGQGFLENAAKVYRDLLTRDPANEDVRARLSALESQLEDEQTQFAEVPDTGPSEPTVSPGAGAGSSLAKESPAAETASPLSSADKRVEIFQRWLEAIRNRRLHVS